MNLESPDQQLLESKISREKKEPTLFRALVSFLSAIGLVVFLFFIVGHFDWLGIAQHPASALKGTYVAAAPGDAAKIATPFAIAEYALRFLDGDRVELHMDGVFLDGYYHIERDKVLIETTRSRGQNLSLLLKIDGERLIGSNVVLWRQK